MKQTSFGFIPVKEGKVLLVRHKGGHWSFPKGRPEPKEEPLETAIRELKEETNLDFVKLLHDYTFAEGYKFTVSGQFIDKTVVYYLGEVKGDVKIQVEELQDFRWVTPEEAIHMITFPEGQRIIAEAKVFIPQIQV